MNHTIESSELSLSIDDDGRVVSLLNKTNGRELIHNAEYFFRIIYQDDKIAENTINGGGHPFRVTSEGQRLTVMADQLICGSRMVEIRVRFDFEVRDDEIIASYDLTNDDDIELMEIVFPMIRGVKSISDDCRNDRVYLPRDAGTVVENPAGTDLSTLSNIRKYEGPEREHTNYYVAYPGEASMQWFEMDGDHGGLYLASYDTTWQSTLLALERSTETGLLSLGIIKYPFLKKGTRERVDSFCISFHGGDWHYGARKYRAWANRTWWKPRESPDWMKQFNGWLRVIMKNQYGAVNFGYADMKRLYVQTDAAGMNVLYILGWIPGGFSRLWPEWVADDDLGGEQELRRQVAEIHRLGGRVLAFLSHFIIDPDSDYYEQVGKSIAIKTLWGRELLFSETYYDEGTWRKIINGNKPMVAMCPSTPEWQEKMMEVANTALSYGVDGVLYDIAGFRPVACHDQNHPHTKPTLAFSSKDQKFKELRENIRQQNPEAIIAMENAVDIWGQYMDLAHPVGACDYDQWHLRAGDGRKGWGFPALYRYTFPEHVLTNRENGHDEVDFRNKVHFAFVHGLRYDMSIFRCKGELDEIPNYKAYLGKVNQLRLDHDIVLTGHYRDDDHFACLNDRLVAKSYTRGDHELGITLWNPSDARQSLEVSVPGYDFVLAADTERRYEEQPESINPDSIMVLLYNKGSE